MILSNSGWLFLYISGFGISNFIVSKYIKKDIHKIIYFIIFGIIGVFILICNKIMNKKNKKIINI